MDGVIRGLDPLVVANRRPCADRDYDHCLCLCSDLINMAKSRTNVIPIVEVSGS